MDISSIWVASVEANRRNSLHSSHTYTYIDDHLTFKLTIDVFVELSPSAEWNDAFFFYTEALSGKEENVSKMKSIIPQTKQSLWMRNTP